MVKGPGSSRRVRWAEVHTERPLQGIQAAQLPMLGGHGADKPQGTCQEVKSFVKL